VFEAIQAWDLSVLSYMREFKDPGLVWLAWAVSTVAWKGWLWWLTIATGWIKGRRHFAVQLALALLVCMVAGLSLKGVIARPRPDLYASQQLNIAMPELLTTQHSFPSGHTLLAAAFAFVVIRYFRGWRAWLAVAFVTAVGLARVYQGMHWPSDIIGSIVMGVAAGAVAGPLCNLPIIRRFSQDKTKTPAKSAGVNVVAGSIR
jgi:membrane-associated phospholipid phosphatase